MTKTKTKTKGRGSQPALPIDPNQQVREQALYAAQDMTTIIKAAQAVYDTAIECMSGQNPPADVLEARRQRVTDTAVFLQDTINTLAWNGPAWTGSTYQLKNALTQAIKETTR